MEDSKDGDVQWKRTWVIKEEMDMFVRRGFFMRTKIPLWKIEARMKLKKIKNTTL